ncbi:MAG: hypothetical protein ACREC1_06625 [Methylovirgula sp.]
MAEYYPLLAKAVAGLPNSTLESRRAVYERARKALVAQLQHLRPPIPEADIARETQALDTAVARLESELAAASGSAAAGPRREPQLAPPAQTPNLGDWKAAMSSRAASRRSNTTAAAATLRDGATKGPPAEIEPARINGRAAAPHEGPSARSEFTRPDAVRPLAPRPGSDEAPQSRRVWIVVSVVVVVVAMVAAAAWKLRDRPEDFGAFKSAVQSPAQQSGKIVKRVGGIASQQPAQKPAVAPTSAVASTPPAASKPAAASTQTATSSAPAENANLPIAYRAALLVEAPEVQSKVKTYVGTVIWRLENVSNDAGQPETAVRADIDVPEDKLKASLEIQKNTDPSLSASHTITIVFTIAPDSPTGGIKQISLPQLRNEDSPNGEPLQGSLVPIMANSFLVGLNRGSAEPANIELIKDREWFDIPILLANGRVAKLTFEKNASGDRAIAEALASWQGQP